MAKRKSLYEKLAEAKIERDLADAKYKELVNIARERFELGSHEEDGVVVSVQENKTFDKKRALKEYGDLVCSMQVDLSKAKEELSGKQLRDLYNFGDHRVTVKIV